ncbi:MAG: hypothetical protein V4492_02750 [Chlamydiota bacterium]
MALSATTPVFNPGIAGPAPTPAIEQSILDGMTSGCLIETPEGARLNLSGVEIGEAEMNAILWLLNNAQSSLGPLLSLDLSDCPGVSKENIDAIAGVLRNNSHLTELSFQPPVHERGALTQIPNDSLRGEQLAMALTVNTTLTHLCFYGQGIRDNGALQFAHVLRVNSSLTSLDLGHNGIQPNAISAIAQAIIANSSLLTLRMFKNCTGEAYSEIAELISKNSTLMRLNISANQIPEQGAIAIGQSLLENSSLIHLNYFSNEVHDAAALIFAEVIRNNSTLQSLDLAFTGISDPNATQIAEALPFNTTLTRLCIGENTEVVWQNAYPAFATALFSNASMTSFDTIETMDDESQHLISAHLERNTLNARNKEATLLELLWNANIDFLQNNS